MPATMKSAAPCVCPTCSAYTVAMTGGNGEYCPACLTVVKRFRGVKLVSPNAFGRDSLRA